MTFDPDCPDCTNGKILKRVMHVCTPVCGHPSECPFRDTEEHPCECTGEGKELS